MLQACPSCGASIAVGVKFCSECGASRSSAPAAETRRLVTLLFCDVTGSTELGELLDAEAVRAVMSRYFALATEAVERHGGTVEKYIGDAVMAVFGLPDLHEDDALRAARAALELRDGVATLGRELEARHGHGLRVRIGLNSGEVVAGEASSRQQLVTGDAVNLAARLEQGASPGEILMGPLTWRLVRDHVDAEPVGALVVKGKAAPVEAQRLIQVLHATEAPSRPVAAPMVGRDAELGQLREAFEAAVASREPQLVTVIGAAGIGKSRLIYEFMATIRDRASVLRGRCLPYGEGITYWPIATALRSAAGVSDGDDIELEATKLAVYVGDLPQADRLRRALAAAIGLGQPSTAREEIAWAVRRLLEGKAAERPLVLVVDDIQWAEETLLELLASIPALGREAPILLLCLARPELLDAHTAWANAALGRVTLRLEPLSSAAATDLVGSLGGQGALPRPIVDLVSATAEGNPLFLEELMAMLLDEGLLVRTDGEWRTTRPFESMKTPPTIQALLAARLDRLDPGERSVAQRAAVIGRIFQRAPVVELSPDAERSDVGVRLASLERREVIRADTTADVPDAYRFRHLLVRDAAYDGLPKRERADLHQRYAAWLVHAVGARLPEVEEIVGYHFEQAFRYRREVGIDDDDSAHVATQAAEHLGAAAYRALDRSDLPAAAGLLGRTLDLTRDDDPRRVELSAELIDAFMQTGRITEAAARLKAMGQEQGVDDDPRLRSWWELMRLSVTLSSRVGNAGDAYRVSDARAVIESAINVFGRSTDAAGLMRAWLAEAHAHYWQLNFSGTTDALDRALGYARVEGRRHHQAGILSWLVNCHAWGPDPIEVALDKLAALARGANGDRRVEAAIGRARAHLFAFAGLTDDANRELDASRATFAEIGMEIEAADIGQIAYWVGLASGRLEESRRRLEASNRDLEALGEEGNLSTSLALEAALLLDEGRVDDADAVMLRAVSFSSPDDLMTRSLCQVLAAQLDVHRGNLDRASAAAEAALDSLADSDSSMIIGYMCTRAAEVHRAAGDEVRAQQLFERAMDQYRQKGATAFATIVERRLASLIGGAVEPR